MTSLPASLREYLESGPLAHLVTLNADGSPQVTVIWIGLDGDDLVSGHMNRSLKVRNVERDPRVVISLARPPEPGVFLAENAVLKGRARVESGGAYELLNRLGKLYVGEDFVFPTAYGSAATDGFVIRTSVERVGGVGPWTQ